MRSGKRKEKREGVSCCRSFNDDLRESTDDVDVDVDIVNFFFFFSSLAFFFSSSSFKTTHPARRTQVLVLEALQDAVRVEDVPAREQDREVALRVVVVGRDLAADGTLDALEHRRGLSDFGTGEGEML